MKSTLEISLCLCLSSCVPAQAHACMYLFIAYEYLNLTKNLSLNLEFSSQPSLFGFLRCKIDPAGCKIGPHFTEPQCSHL